VRVLEVAQGERIARGGAASAIAHERAHGDVLVRSQVWDSRRLNFSRMKYRRREIGAAGKRDAHDVRTG